MVKVNWSRKALKQRLTIDKRYQKAISEKVTELESFPSVRLDIVSLKGKDDMFRLRVGDYRIIFQIIKGEPVICEIKEVKRRTSTTY
ncbi:type II toxin-antitoxin system RelE family toxin [Dickeya solani]|uniref:Type II toxin-antitoxin system RelE/ParE family toxin n=1 Tax=Dickeya solani TaxID=1089444 RepID=A0ABU4EEA1_9GAMM|nr:type II toxin-antitoxin system RelE/ParE family toxin [Dickeya solani]MCA7001659.1 type II toxin-antitoxin system RelE/ParE family toxin [Dickeya solani]MCZ0821055.1 type II toxin-antitoxin system RelE/ParE family toxin [Dickeya solani]MDV6997430.1 type II toxin-antitoxin system RelE/ParE family toxin [Dickeya solani]MDV7003072.1 type II toxin-antitoxin system RelE/ParE family toxin [Dickeya solani]MDV7040236.1 type II toxin-antitoxin system RelE/ParE family toxin [Dickeya solani]